MTRTIITLVVFAACESNNAKSVDSSVIDSQVDSSTIDSSVLDSILLDASIDAQMVDGATDSSPADSPIDSLTPPVDSIIVDAAIDAGNVATCSSGVTIAGRSVVIGTVVSGCPRNHSVDITNEIYSAGDVLEERFLQGGVGCGNPAGLRTSVPNPITRVEITFRVRETGESGTCSQN